MCLRCWNGRKGIFMTVCLVIFSVWWGGGRWASLSPLLPPPHIADAIGELYLLGNYSKNKNERKKEEGEIRPLPYLSTEVRTNAGFSLCIGVDVRRKYLLAVLISRASRDLHFFALAPTADIVLVKNPRSMQRVAGKTEYWRGAGQVEELVLKLARWYFCAYCHRNGKCRLLIILKISWSFTYNSFYFKKPIIWGSKHLLEWFVGWMWWRAGGGCGGLLPFYLAK